MFGINANAKKTAAIVAIAVAGVLGAANASAQQVWMEEVLEQQLQASQEEHDTKAAETADSKVEEKADSSAS